jgi:hypothetical protein
MCRTSQSHPLTSHNHTTHSHNPLSVTITQPLSQHTLCSITGVCAERHRVSPATSVVSGPRAPRSARGSCGQLVLPVVPPLGLVIAQHRCPRGHVTQLCLLICGLMADRLGTPIPRPALSVRGPSVGARDCPASIPRGHMNRRVGFLTFKLSQQRKTQIQQQTTQQIHKQAGENDLRT